MERSRITTSKLLLLLNSIQFISFLSYLTDWCDNQSFVSGSRWFLSHLSCQCIGGNEVGFSGNYIHHWSFDNRVEEVEDCLLPQPHLDIGLCLGPELRSSTLLVWWSKISPFLMSSFLKEKIDLFENKNKGVSILIGFTDLGLCFMTRPSLCDCWYLLITDLGTSMWKIQMRIFLGFSTLQCRCLCLNSCWLQKAHFRVSCLPHLIKCCIWLFFSLPFYPFWWCWPTTRP